MKSKKNLGVFNGNFKTYIRYFGVKETKAF